VILLCAHQRVTEASFAYTDFSNLSCEIDLASYSYKGNSKLVVSRNSFEDPEWTELAAVTDICSDSDEPSGFHG
jgi:hypothetical protein